jgi:RNA polymerase sigma factor (sigma-70 family)
MCTIDEGLLAKIAAGDKEAFESLYRLTASAVYGYTLSILKNTHDAEDAMHETFVSVYKGAASYVRQGKPMAWILTIARNAAYMKLKGRRRLTSAGSADEVLSISQAETERDDRDGFAQYEDRELLTAAMKLLDESERQIIVLHAVAGVKHREIAELMETPISTVLSKYKRALEKLRKYLEEEEL